MKLLTWNINHRVKEDPHRMAKDLLSLNPDIIVLTEYRPGVSRKAIESREIFLDELMSSGFSNHIISKGEKEQNLVLIIAKTNLAEGEIKAPAIMVTSRSGKNQEATALPSNVLHVKAPEWGFDILGIRIPDYSKQNQLRRACWDWLLETTTKNRDKPFVILGDFNADRDPSKSPAYYGMCMERMVTDGWQHAQPKTGSSHVTHVGGWEKRLDHIFLTSHFINPQARYISDEDDYAFSGKKSDAMSDHAVLFVEADLKV
jgi:endonuclease/exonuclease/phosphatase family metal-dependent hydrolase